MLTVVSTRGLLRLLELPGLTGRERQVLTCIASGRGAAVSSDTIISAIWGDDPEGGPLSADNLIKVMTCRLRKKGFNIVTRYGFGYCLVRQPAAKRASAAA